MSIQFDRYRLLENVDTDDFKTRVISYLVNHSKASEDTAKMLAKAVVDNHITFQKAIDIVKATTGLGEMSGAVGAGAYPASLHATKKQYMGPELEENSNNSQFKVGQKVTYLRHPAVITKVEKDMMGRWNYNVSYNKGTGLTKATNILNKGEEIKPVNEDAPMLAHGKADISTYTNDGFTHAGRGKGKVKGIVVKDLWEDDDYTQTDVKAADKDNLEEARNYHQFKKEAATRTKTQQMHEAAKMISKRLEEINRLLEYASQMKNELSEGEAQFEYSHNTRNLFEKINTKVIETYTKVKRLK